MTESNCQQLSEESKTNARSDQLVDEIQELHAAIVGLAERMNEFEQMVKRQCEIFQQILDLEKLRSTPMWTNTPGNPLPGTVTWTDTNAIPADLKYPYQTNFKDLPGLKKQETDELKKQVEEEIKKLKGETEVRYGAALGLSGLGQIGVQYGSTTSTSATQSSALAAAQTPKKVGALGRLLSQTKAAFGSAADSLGEA